MCGAFSVTVSAVPILSLFSQANNPQQLKICSWPLLSFCKCNCDVFYTFLTTCSVTTMFSFCVFFFFNNLIFIISHHPFYQPPPVLLAYFINMLINVINCLYATVCCSYISIFLCIRASSAYVFVLSLCTRCFLTMCLSLIFPFLFCRPSDVARCHHAAVTAGAGAITGHAHHGKHTCFHMFANHTQRKRPLLCATAS